MLEREVEMDAEVNAVRTSGIVIIVFLVVWVVVRVFGDFGKSKRKK